MVDHFVEFDVVFEVVVEGCVYEWFHFVEVWYYLCVDEIVDRLGDFEVDVEWFGLGWEFFVQEANGCR